MSAKFDKGQAYLFVQAAASLLFDKSIAADPKRDPRVHFTLGQLGGFPTRKDVAGQAAIERVDMVHLEFEAGREHDGPSNFVVVEKRTGKWRTWPECDLWSREDGDFSVLVPKDQQFCFTFDGIELVYVKGRPTDDFQEGLARARQNLKFFVAARTFMDLRKHAR